ncbi:multicopper oxidase domain-containing protein [Candidatus Nitrosocosmicus hydrocola]|uniref:multicopper oxidase domain-containing protein n=1 Tax=Candidatus Nitrosocosmicus hydrocola TaxID=1826872 RepID=UPI0011E5D1AE|nr:multicopper oxidase domain-containing protein [Candidatus Nitrosocosmicus hydrocola]
MNQNKVTKSIANGSTKSRLSSYSNSNSNQSIKIGDNLDHVIKLKPKEIVSFFIFIMFSLCALIMIFSLSINYTSLAPAVVLAQESDQVEVNENATIENNSNNVTQISALSTTDKNNTIQSSNERENKDEGNSTKLITLVTEDVELDIAPGKKVKAWTFNGTVPGPTIRLAEGENVTIKYINKSPIPHTIHFHGNHDDVNDGVIPQVMPGQTYLYNITGEPAGALMYHCHAPPTSLHIRMGMYGALIVDPINKEIAPAKEFVMVMGEYSLKNQMGLDADYYMINGYADQYMHNPLEINHPDLMRIYLINLGTTIPASFHLHSTTFLTYPSGLWDNLPIHSQTVSVAPGDASIVEAKWKYPGTYLFHAHGIQEEKGNMGQIKVIGQGESAEGLDTNIGNNSNTITTNPNVQQHQQSNKTLEVLTESVSMFDWQYELQKKLQNPIVVSSQSDHKGIDREEKKIMKEMDQTKNIQKQGENHSLAIDKTLATNVTESSNANSSSNSNQISIVPGSSSPDSKVFYDPANAEVQLGTEVTWVNNDTNMPHTVTSGNSGTGPTGVFDSGIMMGDGSSYKHVFDKKGEFEYYCTLHPWMIDKIIVK